jgi:HEPN domain-containing protein
MNQPELHEDPTRTTPIGLARYACEFLEAALAADDKMGNKKGHEIVAPIPVMFLVGQSVELALKAFLLSKGIELRKLRRDYGHELHRSLRKAKEFGLFELVTLSEEELSVIELLDDLYSTKQLQYIVTGSKTFPVFGPLEKAALKLAHAIGNAVGYPPKGLPNAL